MCIQSRSHLTLVLAMLLATALGTTQLAAQVVEQGQQQNAPPAPPAGAGQPQTDLGQGQSVQPKELQVAPMAPKNETQKRAEEISAAAPTGGPAIICHELVAFLQPKPPAAAPGGTPAAASQPQGQSAGQAEPPAPQTSGQTKSVPNASGQNPAAAAPGQTAPATDKAQQASGQSASIPTPDGAQRRPHISLEQAQAMAGANDLRGCQAAAQEMRRAGVGLPAGLIALAALRPDLVEAATR